MQAVRSLVAVEVWGPEPIGAGQAGRLQHAYRQNGRGFKAEDRGAPVHSYAGDLGPLQRFTVLRVSGARGTTRKGLSQALPATSSSNAAQAALGLAGI